MSLVVTVTVNGVDVPVTLSDDTVAVIAAAIPAATREDTDWPAWMSVETAARYLDVSPERMRKLVARRQIPFTQEGKGCRVSFARADLDQWMTDQRVTPRGGDA